MLRTSLAALAAVSLAFGCSHVTEPDVADQRSDIVDPNDSNIRSPDIGPITKLKVLPNTNVPKAVLVSLMFRGYPNQSFVMDLYDQILAINEAEGLHGAEGYEQQFNLIVMGSAEDYGRLLSMIRERRGIPADEPVPLINLVEHVMREDLWAQDFGEFAMVEGANAPGQSWYGLLDSERGRGFDVRKLGSILGIPVTRIRVSPYDVGDTGSYGGNIEATAEGNLYIGNTAPRDFINGLKALGNPNPIVLPTFWLAVGHVDEFVAILPARNRCNSALMVASPLEGLNLARRHPEGIPRGAELAAAVDAYAKHPRPIDEDYTLDDFEDHTTSGWMEWTVKYNLWLEKDMLESVALMEAGSCVEQVVRLPQVFKIEESTGKGVAMLPGTANSLVLRNHVIVPDPKTPAFRSITKERYAEAIGSEANVHFIDDTIYHQNLGNVHCGTNVIRELNMPYRLP